MTPKPTIALCVIATGKYDQFVEPLAESVREHFLPGYKVDIGLFSDSPMGEDIVDRWFIVNHCDWPGPTLYRYRWMLQAAPWLSQHDYIFYVDADCRFVDTFGPEILGSLVAVEHQGYVDQEPDTLPYERNEASKAYIPLGSGIRYYAGGFQGGNSGSYLHAISTMEHRISWDEMGDVTAVWHDESHWNRYLMEGAPEIILPPTYLSSDVDPVPNPKLLALTKNHDEIRRVRP